jgi:hypothetical protein
MSCGEDKKVVKLTTTTRSIYENIYSKSDPIIQKQTTQHYLVSNVSSSGKKFSSIRMV